MYASLFCILSTTRQSGNFDIYCCRPMRVLSNSRDKAKKYCAKTRSNQYTETIWDDVGRALVESKTLDRRVVGLNPDLAANVWTLSKFFTYSCLCASA